MPFADLIGHARAVRTLRAGLSRGRVHHAWLFAGISGVGKELCARLFAQALNCERPGDDACGACGSCRKIAHHNHPDVAWLMPEAEAVARKLVAKSDLEGTPSRDIRVEQVRALRSRLALKAIEARRRVAIVALAERMNATAQNVLLKTLEEPPPDTVLILVSGAADALLPTIRSRCVRVSFGPLPAEVVARELQARAELAPEQAALMAAMAQGSLGAALALDAEALGRRRDLVSRAAALADAEGAVRLAEELKERDQAEEALEGLSLFWRDVAALASGGAALRADLAELAAERAQALGARGALARADACARALEGLAKNGNPRLMLERCFLEGGLGS